MNSVPANPSQAPSKEEKKRPEETPSWKIGKVVHKEGGLYNSVKTRVVKQSPAKFVSSSVKNESCGNPSKNYSRPPQQQNSPDNSTIRKGTPTSIPEKEGFDAGEGDNLLKALPPYTKKGTKVLPPYLKQKDKTPATPPSTTSKKYGPINNKMRRGQVGHGSPSSMTPGKVEASCLSLSPQSKVKVEERAQTAKEFASPGMRGQLRTVEEVTEDKVIQELFNAASVAESRKKEMEEKKVRVVPVSPSSSATSSVSTFQEVKEGETSVQKMLRSCTKSIVRQSRPETVMAIERIQYRKRMEEILEQPVKELVSFSKGVLLLKHENTLEGTLRLTNLSSEPINVRVTSSIPPRYKIQPRLTMIDPDKSACLRISTRQLYTPAQIQRDKFYIESAIAGEFPAIPTQLFQFWKTIPISRVQKAQTNLVFIFHSTDPKFRSILGGDFENTSSSNRPLSESMPLTSDPAQSLHSKSYHNNASTKSTSCTASLYEPRKEMRGSEVTDVSTVSLRKSMSDTIKSEVNPKSHYRHLLMSLIQACPFAAGFMFFLYQTFKI